MPLSFFFGTSPSAISGAGHRGVDLSSGLERWARGLGGANPLRPKWVRARTHFPEPTFQVGSRGFAAVGSRNRWVRSGFAPRWVFGHVGSQWVRAKVGSRKWVRVGSQMWVRGKWVRVGNTKVGSQWVRESGFASGFAKRVGSHENVSGETGFADSGFASGFAWNPLAFRSGFGPPSPHASGKYYSQDGTD